MKEKQNRSLEKEKRNLFSDFWELLNEEIRECDKEIERRNKYGLMTIAEIQDIKPRPYAKYCRCYSEKNLNSIDIYLQDAILFKKDSYIPSVKDIIQNPQRFEGILGIVWYHAGNDFYSVFEKDKNVELRQYYCIKANEILSLLVQFLALKNVEESQTPQGEWINRIILSKSGSAFSPTEVNFLNPKLNESQKTAVKYSVTVFNTPQSFYLIPGPPGTGKTTTITEIIVQAINQNKKVLLTSHTNVAVDNALEQVLEKYPHLERNLLRLAHVGKVPPIIRKILPAQKQNKEMYRNNVTGATLSKIANMTYLEMLDWGNPFFDVAIIDESSMATFPLTFIGLLHAKSFILVGDQHQLPPIIRSDKISTCARKSFFEFLIENYQNLSTLLDTQYRSNEAIMLFSNENIYENKLRTHSSNQDLHISRGFLEEGAWGEITDPNNIIVWVRHPFQHDWIYRRASGRHSAYNELEAAICLKIISKFKEQGVSIDDIAVVTYYRLQADLLKRGLSNYFSMDKNDVRRKILTLDEDMEEFPLSSKSDAQTIDSYQGRQKDIVIISFVHNSPHKAIDDYRRLNVAITRAKSKVIIIGSFGLLDINNIWASYANPYNLYKVVKELERNPLRDNKGKIIFLNDREQLKDEIKIIENAKGELESKPSEQKSWLDERDRQLLRELRK